MKVVKFGIRYPDNFTFIILKGLDNEQMIVMNEKTSLKNFFHIILIQVFLEKIFINLLKFMMAYLLFCFSLWLPVVSSNLWH